MLVAQSNLKPVCEVSTKLWEGSCEPCSCGLSWFCLASCCCLCFAPQDVSFVNVTVAVLEPPLHLVDGTVVTLACLQSAVGKLAFILWLKPVNNCFVDNWLEVTSVLEADAICSNTDGPVLTMTDGFAMVTVSTCPLSAEMSSLIVVRAITDFGGCDIGIRLLLHANQSMITMVQCHNSFTLSLMIGLWQ